MTWQQLVVLATLIWSLVINTINFAKSKTLSSGEVALSVFLVVALLAGYAAVLHAGNFW